MYDPILNEYAFDSQEIYEKQLVNQIINGIDNAIGDINAQIKVNDKNTNSNRIRFAFYIAADKRERYVNIAKELIALNPDYEEITVASSRVRKEFAFRAKGVGRIIHVDTKPTGKRSSADPNELLTAAISCIKDLKIPVSIKELDETIQKAKEVVLKGKIKDYKKADLDSFEKNYTNTCQAVSAALAIQEFIGGPAEVAYMTGQRWNDDVSKFRISAHGMKDFNSSDIVFKKKSSYYGISLKKKERLTEKDPTLINKAFDSLLQNTKFTKARAKIDNITAKFFVSIIMEAIDNGEIMLDNKTIRPTKYNWKDFVGKLSTEYICSKLKGRESLFKELAEIVDKYSGEIASTVLDIALKTDLKDLKDQDFHFALVTGIGAYGPNKGVVIETADLKRLDTMVEKTGNLLSKDKPRLELDSDKTQAFDNDSTSAILQYILKIGQMNILDVKIRYKGKYTSQPSYLATMTNEFKEYLKDK